MMAVTTVEHDLGETLRALARETKSDAHWDLPSAALFADATGHPSSTHLVDACHEFYDVACAARAAGLIKKAFLSQDDDLQYMQRHAKARAGLHPLWRRAAELHEMRYLAVSRPH